MNMLIEEEDVQTIPQISVEKADLVSALSALVKFVPTKPGNAALTGVHACLREGQGLKLQTTNGVSSAEVNITNMSYDGPYIEDDMPLTFLVPMKVFLALLMGYPEGEVILEVQDSQLLVKSGKLNYHVVMMDDSAFPHINIGNEYDWDSITAEAAESILNGLQQASKAASKDSNKPNLQGVRIIVTDDITSFFATDTRHMLEVSKKINGGLNVSEFTMPAEGIEALSTVFNPETKIKIATHDQGIWAIREDGNVRIGVRAYQQKYPDMSKILELKQEKAAVVNKDDLKSTLQRMRAFINSSSQKVTMTFEGMFMTLAVSSTDGQADESLTISPYTIADPDGVSQKTFDEMDQGTPLGFRLTSLADAISSFVGDELVFRMSGPKMPVLIHSTDPRENSRYITSLITR